MFRCLYSIVFSLFSVIVKLRAIFTIVRLKL